MKSIVIPLDDLPAREELPADLVQPRDDRWQHGVRVVDWRVRGVGRVTAGSWHSGRFATKPFSFGGCEWLHVLSGTIVFDIAGTHHEISAGKSALVPRGLSCRWVQPEPVLKYFLRWDDAGEGQPTQFWCSGMPETEMAEGALAISTTKASWHHAATSVALSVTEGILCLG